MIDRIDHLVLTVHSIEKTAAFYTDVLGMEEETFGDGRKCLRFGSQKINLHQTGKELEPHAALPLSGSADICFISSEDIGSIKARLFQKGVPIECGPVKRTGAEGVIISVYIRDPDGNLIEISNYC